MGARRPPPARRLAPGALALTAVLAVTAAASASASAAAAAGNSTPATTTAACAELGPGVSACWLADPSRDEITVTAAFAPPKPGERLAWAALGLSELGGMAGADIWELTRSGEADAADQKNATATKGGVAGRVASPTSAPFWVVTDAHAPGFERPVTDKQQDVTLSAWAEGAAAARELWLSSAPVLAAAAAGGAGALALAPAADNALAVVLKRRLVTCDDTEDVPLRFGRPLFWIWARGAEKEEQQQGGGKTRLSYHGPGWLARGAALAAPWGPQPPGGAGRPLPAPRPAPVAAVVAPDDGSKKGPAAAAAAAPAAAPAAAAPAAAPKVPPGLPPGTKVLDVTIGGELLLPQNEETVYAVRAVRLPADKKRHVVAYSPLFRGQPFVHHAVLYACSERSAAALERRFGGGGGAAKGTGTASAANGTAPASSPQPMSPGRAASAGELRARIGGGEPGDRLRWRPSGGGAGDWQDVDAEEGPRNGGGGGMAGMAGMSSSGDDAPAFSDCMKFFALGAPTGGASAATTTTTADGASPPGFVAPPGTGLPFGGPSSSSSASSSDKSWWPTHLLVELHFNQPPGQIVEAGGQERAREGGRLVALDPGMRLYYIEEEAEGGKKGTNKGTIDLGLITNAQYALSIPPGLETFAAPPSVCSAACTARALGKSAPRGVTIVGRTFHMHGIGKSAVTRRFRPAGGPAAVARAAQAQQQAMLTKGAGAGTSNATATASANATPQSSPLRFVETPPVSELARYDYNYQAFLPPIQDGVSDRLMPGDALVTSWVFDSSSRANATSFGPSTQDEMALDWIVYYPAVPELSSCMSVPLRAVARAALERGPPGQRAAAGGNGTAAAAAAAAAASSPSSKQQEQQKELIKSIESLLPETLAVCSRDDAWGERLFGGLARAARKGGDAARGEVAALLRELYESGNAVPALPDLAAVMMPLPGGGGGTGGGGAGAGATAAAAARAPPPPPPGLRACSSERPLP